MVEFNVDKTKKRLMNELANDAKQFTWAPVVVEDFICWLYQQTAMDPYEVDALMNEYQEECYDVVVEDMDKTEYIQYRIQKFKLRWLQISSKIIWTAATGCRD